MKFDTKIDCQETKEDECKTMIKCTQDTKENKILPIMKFWWMFFVFLVYSIEMKSWPIRSW